MDPYKRIFIIGHPGSGKGLLAKTVAEKMGWKFIDADLGLESHIGLSIVEIVGKQGEVAFQNCASQILISQIKKENIVVATDASIVSAEKNRQLLSSEFVVYLKVSTPVQLERTLRNPDPLLSIADITTFLDKLHQERDALYEQVASFTINGDNSNLNEHVLSIVKIVSEADIEPISNQLKLDEKDLIFFHKTLHIPVRLSDQQAACLKLLAQGKTSKEIARALGISNRTVEHYMAKTMELLGCSSSKELIALYHDQP